MNPIFGRGPSLPLRLSIAVVFSFLVMALDYHSKAGMWVRSYLQTVVSPLLYAANAPAEMLQWGTEQFMSRQSLMQENKRLRELILLQNEALQKCQALRQENQKLRSLLQSQQESERTKILADVLKVHSSPYSHQVVINRGIADGVFVGQAVLDDLGIVGQVVDAGQNSSKVMLITDQSQGIPVQVERNGVRAVAEGMGKINELKLNHIAHSTDIRVGDLLLSSGLGDVYPAGYPVALVKSVIKDDGLPFAQITAEPIALLGRVRYVLLLGKPETQNLTNTVMENGDVQ